MIVIPFTIVLILISLFGNKFIRNHNTVLYVAFTITAVLSFVFIEKPLLTPFRQGFLGLAFYYVVMMTGALDKKSKLRKSLMSVRREYSIIGFIVVSPHAIYQTIKYLNGDISLPIYGVVAYLIMVPLFITSFKVIRKKFKYKNWKTLQNFAYLVYIGLFLHLIFNSQKPNTIIYVIMFSMYLVLKIKFTYIAYKHKIEN